MSASEKPRLTAGGGKARLAPIFSAGVCAASLSPSFGGLPGGKRRKECLRGRKLPARPAKPGDTNAFGGPVSPPNLPTAGASGWSGGNSCRMQPAAFLAPEWRSKRSRRWERDVFPVKALPTSVVVRQSPAPSRTPATSQQPRHIPRLSRTRTRAVDSEALLRKASLPRRQSPSPAGLSPRTTAFDRKERLFHAIHLCPGR